MEKQELPATVPASIGDPIAAIERANALVSVVLSGLLKRKRSIAGALMYVLALGRDVRANCWDLSGKAGLEPGDDTFHRLLGRYRWSWERGREMLPGLAQQALGAGPDADDEIGPGLAVDETTGLKRGTTFATKPELAIAQVKAIIERGVQICWVAADEAYGRSGDFGPPAGPCCCPTS